MLAAMNQPVGDCLSRHCIPDTGLALQRSRDEPAPVRTEPHPSYFRLMLQRLSKARRCGDRVPHLHRLIETGGGNPAAIRTETAVIHGLPVADFRGPGFGQRPQPRRLVLAGRENAAITV